MALVTLQTIFQDAFPAYEQMHPLPAHVRRAARAVMQATRHGSAEWQGQVYDRHCNDAINMRSGGQDQAPISGYALHVCRVIAELLISRISCARRCVSPG